MTLHDAVKQLLEVWAEPHPRKRRVPFWKAIADLRIAYNREAFARKENE